jgi:hypothetical protein
MSFSLHPRDVKSTVFKEDCSGSEDDDMAMGDSEGDAFDSDLGF